MERTCDGMQTIRQYLVLMLVISFIVGGSGDDDGDAGRFARHRCQNICAYTHLLCASRHRGTSATSQSSITPANAFAAVKTFHLIKKKREMRKILVKYFLPRCHSTCIAYVHIFFFRLRLRLCRRRRRLILPLRLHLPFRLLLGLLLHFLVFRFSFFCSPF